MKTRYKGYCRSLAAIDESTGRLLDMLSCKGILNDTLVIYSGDNGHLWGEHGLIDKRAMYEPSIRVPMIDHCPDLFGPGKRTEIALNNIGALCSRSSRVALAAGKPRFSMNTSGSATSLTPRLSAVSGPPNTA